MVSISPTPISILTTLFTPSRSDLNFPALTTFYTPPPECRDQWRLPNPDRTDKIVFSTAPDMTDYSAYSSYISCQPLQHEGFFSPGICPEDRTVDALAEIHLSIGGSLVTHYEARCCPIGMGVRYSPYDDLACASRFSTPLRASAPVTIPGDTSSGPYGEAYAEEIETYIQSARAYSWYTVSNITTLTSGLAIAQPIFVGWQEKDLSLFPAAYATSLAKVLKLSFTPTSSPGASAALPQETGSPRPSGLSTGARAGIGIGAAFGAIVIIGTAILCLYLRRRRRQYPIGAPGNDLPEMVSEQNEHIERGQHLENTRWSETTVDKRVSELSAKMASRELEGSISTGDLDVIASHMVPGPRPELEAAERGTETQSSDTAIRYEHSGTMPTATAKV